MKLIQSQSEASYLVMTSIQENKLLKNAISRAFWLILWQLAALKVGKELILPSPFAVVKALGGLVVTASFWQNTFATILRVLSGYCLGIVSAVILAVLTCSSDLADSLLSPIIRIVRATPVASFIILALVWLSSKKVSVFIVFLMVLPIVYGNLLEGVKSESGRLREMARVFQVPPGRRALFISLPQLKPHLLSALSLSLGLSWKSGVAAEIIGVPRGSMGAAFYEAKLYLDTPSLYA